MLLIINHLFFIITLLICIAFYTLAERKILSFFHRRFGPNIVGFVGLLQPLADGIKLIIKNIIIPLKAQLNIFLMAPLLLLILSLFV